MSSRQSGPPALLARLPRVRFAPRGRGDDGADAVALASSYGLTADDWQADVLADWLRRSRAGRWSAATCGLAVPRQNGKNAVIEIRELFGMVLLGERILHTAHEVKTARKAFIRIASFFENERDYPELAGMVREIRKTNGQEAVLLANGGGIEFIARSRGSGRGFTVDVLVCDEAQDLTDEELAALLPTISAAPLANPQVILTGTPPDPAKRSQGEVFRRVRSDGEGKRDPRLAWSDFGVTDGPLPDVNDRALWYAANPALGGRLNVAEVERELGLMAPETFARERLGWWGDPEADEAGPIDLREWAVLTAVDPERVTSCTIALDVSPDRRSAAIGLAGLSGDRVLVAVEAAGGSSWVVPKLRQILAEKRVVEVSLYPRSQAGALIPDLVAAGIKFTALTAGDMGQACSGFQVGVKERSLAHVAQAELDRAVANARVRVSGESESWDRKERSVDISPLVAVSVAAHRFRLVAQKKKPAPVAAWV